jgi:hypothetical protein
MATRTRSTDEQAAEVLAEIQADADKPAEAALPEERKFNFRTPGFSRMRFEWRPDDQEVITSAREQVERQIITLFADAYQVMYEVYETVRTQAADANGEPLVDHYGLPVWVKTNSGAWEEDFTRLTSRAKEHFLFKITTNLFDWEQRSADLWGEAMFAKAQWEERFAIAFDEGVSGTVDDRRARGNKDAAEERYFAIFLSLLSRKADAIVRSLNLLGQRLKDSMQ